MGTPHDWMGYPPTTMTGWGTPHHDWMGYPPLTSIASTCYAAAGMPLAFTQEDFLIVDYLYYEKRESQTRYTFTTQVSIRKRFISKGPKKEKHKIKYYSCSFQWQKYFKRSLLYLQGTCFLRLYKDVISRDNFLSDFLSKTTLCQTNCTH